MSTSGMPAFDSSGLDPSAADAASKSPRVMSVGCL